MESSIEIKPEDSTLYDPNAALEFFKLYGKPESAKQDEVIFSQGQKANRFLLQHDKLYLLVKGKVNIQVSGETVASVKPGEIFGELTPLILSARSATAIADVPCRLMSLSDKQLISGLKKQPEFALMLMNLLVRYLRKAATETKSFSTFSESKNSIKNAVFDLKTRRNLIQKLGDQAVVSVPKQRVIFQEGGSGMLMYVILEGYVTSSIADKVVERGGPGSVIGEVALIDQKKRVAKVVAETNCSLLAFNRQMFLELVKSQPSFGISLLRALATRLYSCRAGRPSTSSSFSEQPEAHFTGF